MGDGLLVCLVLATSPNCIVCLLFLTLNQNTIDYPRFTDYSGEVKNDTHA